MIKTKQFQILTDIDLVWKLMTEVYNHEETNGPAAPFFEYAVTSPWHDRIYDRLSRFWMDGDVPVGFVFYESEATEIFFVLRPGYEALADEMIAYADTAFPKFDEPTELVLSNGQTALIEAAKKRGYRLAYEDSDLYFDFRTGTLDHPLPAGYHFVEQKDNDPLKVAKCLWDGFNKWELGEFVNWDIPARNNGRSPHELYQNVLGATIAPAPHATYEFTTVIADENEDYVCFSGMWWVPENKLAYMEPLCTVPEHQHKGLAAAALARHERNLRPLGAEVMTGGGNDFYRKIGYRGVHVYGHYRKTDRGE